jgi:hypothetical protein
MELFVVADAMVMGQGVFGIFSTQEKARTYMDDFASRTNFRCTIAKHTVLGADRVLSRVCVAYIHDWIYDVYTLDGLYAEPFDAYEATGDKGMIVEFVVDNPEQKQNVEVP